MALPCPTARRRPRALTTLMRRPELGALAGTLLVILVFAAFAGDTGLFTPRGIINVLQVSAELGILATAVALLMIGGEFDLSIGSMVGFAGMVIGLGVTEFHLPIVLAVLRRLRLRGADRLHQRPARHPHRAAVLHRDARLPLHPARPDAGGDPRRHRADADPLHHRRRDGQLGRRALRRHAFGGLFRWLAEVGLIGAPAGRRCRRSPACRLRCSGGSALDRDRHLGAPQHALRQLDLRRRRRRERRPQRRRAGGAREDRAVHPDRARRDPLRHHPGAVASARPTRCAARRRSSRRSSPRSSAAAC